MHPFHPLTAVSIPPLFLLTPQKGHHGSGLGICLGMGRMGHEGLEGGDEGSRHVRGCPQSQVDNTVLAAKR